MSSTRESAAWQLCMCIYSHWGSFLLCDVISADSATGRGARGPDRGGGLPGQPRLGCCSRVQGLAACAAARRCSSPAASTSGAPHAWSSMRGRMHHARTWHDVMRPMAQILVGRERRSAGAAECVDFSTVTLTCMHHNRSLLPALQGRGCAHMSSSAQRGTQSPSFVPQLARAPAWPPSCRTGAGNACQRLQYRLAW